MFHELCSQEFINQYNNVNKDTKFKELEGVEHLPFFGS